MFGDYIFDIHYFCVVVDLYVSQYKNPIKDPTKHSETYDIR